MVYFWIAKVVISGDVVVPLVGYVGLTGRDGGDQTAEQLQLAWGPDIAPHQLRALAGVALRHADRFRPGGSNCALGKLMREGFKPLRDSISVEFIGCCANAGSKLATMRWEYAVMCKHWSSLLNRAPNSFSEFL
jgi:hypothetical protein